MTPPPPWTPCDVHPPQTLSPDAAHAEETRLVAAYAKRSTDDPRYSWLSPGYCFMLQEQERQLLAVLKRDSRRSLATSTLLDVGCGTGDWLRAFVKWGAQPEHLAGIDLLPDRLTTARHLCPPGVRFHCGSAANLPFAAATFDLVLQSTVFTSVLDARMRHRIAAEMRRVVKDDGLILWYDFRVNNPWNADVRGITKGEIAQLFPDCHLRLRRLTLAPPLVRWLAPYSWLACYVLGTLPWLCTHYLGVVRKHPPRR